MADWKRRTAWRILLSAAVVTALTVITTRLAEVGPHLELNQWLLPLLALAVIVLLLGLAGVLIRNLVRLIIERKRGLLGSRLRSKLVFFFLALVLLPALVLFVGSTQFIKRSVEGMLRTPVEDIHDASQAIVDAWSERLEQDTLRAARAVAAEAGRTGLSQAALDGARVSRALDWIQLRRGLRVELRAAGGMTEVGVERGERSRLIEELVEEVRQRATALSRVDRLGERLIVHAAAPVPGDAVRVVSTGLVLPTEMAGRMAMIARGKTDFNNFRRQRRDLVRFYLYLTALIFLATAFVASWIGFYLARRITGPIQELAAATREISAGNLGVRVRAEVGDELGTLVESFNEMAGELQESREVITRSTADLRRSNQALDERRRYIETLIANISTAVISLDRVGRVTTANPAVETVLELRLDPGVELRPLLEERGLGALVELIDDALRYRRESPRRDLSLSLRRGAVSVAVQVSPLQGAGGEDLGILLMVEDLTDLLRAQRAAAWREVARRIAHEIKNPLTPIQLSAQRLRKKFEERSADLDQVLRDATDSIEREVWTLKHLVDEFSRYARLPEVQPRPVAFEEVVASVMALYRGHQGIEWTVETDPRLGTVMVDADQMRRALINLIDNAVAAMGGHGQIRIAARPFSGPGSVRIEVADSGPGIPPADRDKMFVPYFSTKSRGTGLGLAIVHRVVTDHRGTIRVEDNEPTGARFVIEIPA